MKFLDEELQPKPYYHYKHKYIGTINLLDGKVDITDPSYEEDTWCAFFNCDIKPGKYKCYIDVVNFPYSYICEENDNDSKNLGKKLTKNDYRIMSVEIIHEETNQENIKYTFKCFNIGVDSGLCGFYNHKPNFEKENDWTKFWQNLKCLPKIPYVNCDCNDKGITVSSGFGDGSYDLLEVLNDNKETIALKLDFNS